MKNRNSMWLHGPWGPSGGFFIRTIQHFVENIMLLVRRAKLLARSEWRGSGGRLYLAPLLLIFHRGNCTLHGWGEDVGYSCNPVGASCMGSGKWARVWKASPGKALTQGAIGRQCGQ
ncbi:MAG: hypothetical protein JSS84_02590 [Bacteroidetes bacterium]|nr:hypothetical protein [Bacteroidota bacterium]